MGDLDFEQIHNFIMWYILVERVMFKSVAPNRYKNNNCRTLSDSDVITAISNFTRCPEGADDSRRNLERFISLVMSQCDKYSALNLLPLRNYGSLEFRHHHGTLSGEEILSWINIILSLRKWSLENVLSKTYLEVNHRVVYEIFKGTDLISKLPPDYDMLFQQGLMDIKQIFNYSSLALETSELLESCRPTTKTTLFYRYKKANNVIKESV